MLSGTLYVKVSSPSFEFLHQNLLVFIITVFADGRQELISLFYHLSHPVDCMVQEDGDLECFFYHFGPDIKHRTLHMLDMKKLFTSFIE